MWKRLIPHLAARCILTSVLLLHSFLCVYFNKFIYFNWRLITLQYCIGFSIHQHESATGIHFLFKLVKINSKLVVDLHVKCKPIKLLDNNIRENLDYHRFGSDS